MYRIAICDDDREYIGELERMIRESNGGRREICFEEYVSGLDLLKKISGGVDILFLDIQMGGLDGNRRHSYCGKRISPACWSSVPVCTIPHRKRS